jgi:hypothetical protein
LHGGNTGLRKKGKREVMARHGGRATGVHARVARRNSDVAVAAALRGGDAEGVCPYAVGSGELGRGWRWIGPRGAHGCASAWCLRGTGLGSWRLDGLHAVSARKEEAEALREASLSSSWRRHLDCEATAQWSSGKATMECR